MQLILARLFALAALLAAGGAVAQPASIPVETFFEDPAMHRARLSPDGRFVALGVTPKGGRARLVVLDIATSTAKVAINPDNADVHDFHWVNDERLVFTVRDSATSIGDTQQSGGLFAVQRDGSDYRQLVSRESPWVREGGAQANLMSAFTQFHSTTANRDSDDIFVVQHDVDGRGEWHTTNLFRLDTRTGRATRFDKPAATGGWVMDNANVPRVIVTVDGPRAAVQYLDAAQGKWRVLQAFDRFSDDGMEPLALGKDGSLYVAARKGGDKKALYRFDLARNELDAEPIVSLKDFDFDGSVVMRAGEVIGIRYLSDARAAIWFDPKRKEVQAAVDKLLPATSNHLQFAQRGQVRNVLVHSYTDVEPGTYRLFDTETGRLTEIGRAMPGVDPRQMAQRDLVRYKARDGLEIPAWITIPKGGKGRKLPMVVLVHGGPWVRGGEWRWDADSQFLASRGYVVLEPEFRGSLGYGAKHYKSSFKQWGLAMQDDVADGAKWAIGQGIADPSRICIAGASYGGYATLMGLVKDPDLFKCGVNWVGVTDIEMMYTVHWSDFSSVYRRHGMPVMVGDREKDAAQLKATSPLQQADRIKAPLLLAYGGVDRRVPAEHGTRLRDAVKKTNPNVEWVEYPGEGHGWYLVKTRVDFWTRVEKFLEKHIGKPP